MARTVTIKAADRYCKRPDVCTVEMNGGNPWYAYLEIDGEVYLFYRHANGRVYKLEKTG